MGLGGQIADEPFRKAAGNNSKDVSRRSEASGKMRWQREPSAASAAILALVIFAQILWLGADSALLAVAAAELNLLAALLAVVLLAPPGVLWARSWPVYLLLATALGWAAFPQWIAGDPFFAALAVAPRPAPDLLPTMVTRYMGVMGVITAAAVIGFRRGMMRASVDYLLIFAAFAIVVGLGMRQWDPLHVWGFDKGILAKRYTGTLLNANASAAIFGMLTVLSIGRWRANRLEHAGRRRQSSSRRALIEALLLVLAIAALGSCILTGSRTAVSLTLGALAAFFLLDLLASNGRSRHLWIGTAALGLGLFLIMALAGEVLLNRVHYLQADAVDRLQIWSHYWQLVRQSPWQGYGLGSFSTVNLQSLADPAEARAFWYINDAHNVVLQMLLEGGWPYFALIAFGVMLILTSIHRASSNEGSDPLARSMLLALLLVFGCSLTDIALSVPAVVSLSAALLGLLWGRSLRAGADRLTPI